MPVRNLIVGDESANSINGSAGADLIYGFDPKAPQHQASSLTATRVASGFAQPLFGTAPPDDFNHLYVVEKGGAIRILDLASGSVQATPFLDLRGTLTVSGEGGLLGLAFDPGFAQNRYFYVNVTNAAGDTEIRRYQVSASDPTRADPASSTLILTVDQPDGVYNHKGGWLGFGPDGYLYAALGDGGGGGDPQRTAQNIDSLLGKMLRIDVSADAFPDDANRNYAIPAGNMFAGTAGADEIYALGLRNPWRPSFDRATGDFYIADVGQGQWEEIDLGASGANYGWSLYEGPAAYNPGTPSAGTLTPPIYSYDRTVGSSITGGYAYRGESEALQGQYFFGDFVAGKIFTLDFNGTSWQATDRTSQITTNIGAITNVSSFAEDGLGNLYVIDFDGEIFRLTPNAASTDQGDTLNGGGGADILYGGSGNDVLRGGADNDWLYGGAGTNWLFGDDGIDRLIGGASAETLYGGAGNDFLFGKGGNDRLFGDVGFDTAIYSERASAVTMLSFNNTIAVLSGGESGRDRVEGVESFQFSDAVVSAGTVGGFQAYEYTASYADLIRAFGGNQQAAFNHYVDYGFTEGRALDRFDGWTYLASYDDLLAAIGPNEAAAARHYVNNGFNEGRPLNKFLGWDYLASHTELVATLGPDQAAAAKHYVTVGYGGGMARDSFDNFEYIASYPDLIRALGTDSVGAARHYVKHGIAEGRQVDLFDAEQYLANYGDLRAAFGDDLERARLHFIQHGYYEGRTDQDIFG